MGETTRRICGDVLVVPVGLSGHVNPMMYVVKQLLKRGLTVTMMLSEDELSLMKSHIDVKDNPNFQLELVPSHTKGARHGMGPRTQNFERVCEPFRKRLLALQQAGGEGPKGMLVDQFMAWTHSWASELGIPRFVFIVSPATFGYALYNHSANIAKGILESKEKDPILDLPGIPPVRLGDLTSSATSSAPVYASSGDTFDGSEGLLLNTFYDLEAPAIDAFRARIESKGGKGPKLIPVGPVLPADFFGEGTYQGVAGDSECIQWLDNRPDSSVVYIAFGSLAHISPPQILELAKGLEASRESFLWVLLVQGGKANVANLLPPGFQEQTKDRGLVYPEFAPQLQILSHRATGGFLSHCGWNSSLEAIAKGVPMIGWPLMAEQKLCCRVLVDQAKIAIDIRPGHDGSADLVTSEEVVTALKCLMRQEQGQELKTRALGLQSRAKAAMAPGGSSIENFNALVEIIRSGNSRNLQIH